MLLQATTIVFSSSVTDAVHHESVGGQQKGESNSFGSCGLSPFIVLSPWSHVQAIADASELGCSFLFAIPSMLHMEAKRETQEIL